MTGGIQATTGTQTFNTLTNVAGAGTTMQITNATLMNPYHSQALLRYAAETPDSESASGTWVPLGGINFVYNIKSLKTIIRFHNPNNTTAWLTLYKCKARRDQPGPGFTTTWDDVEELLYRGWNQNFSEGGTFITTYTSATNVRKDVTIYESPFFTKQWKVVKKNTWKFRPGTNKTVRLPFRNNYYGKIEDRWYNTLVAGSPFWNYLKGDYMYLWQLRGEDAVGAIAPASVYNIPTTQNVSLSFTGMQKLQIGSMVNQFKRAKQYIYNYGASSAISSGDNFTTIANSVAMMGVSDTTIAPITTANVPQGGWISTIL